MVLNFRITKCVQCPSCERTGSLLHCMYNSEKWVTEFGKWVTEFGMEVTGQGENEIPSSCPLKLLDEAEKEKE